MQKKILWTLMILNITGFVGQSSASSTREMKACLNDCKDKHDGGITSCGHRIMKKNAKPKDLKKAFKCKREIVSAYENCQRECLENRERELEVERWLR